MPARGEHTAPAFDTAKPRELSRFFAELEYLFKRADLESDSEKKEHILRYVDFETEQIWKTFPEYTNDTQTYQQFKDAILIHYPDATGDYVYSLGDIDLLIGERQCIGITTSMDLSDYHLKFIAITTWLVDKEQLGNLEQERAYIRAFQPPFLAAIMNRLQVKFPDHHPNIPHKVKDVYGAARFILQAGSATQTYMPPLPAAPYQFQPASVKHEASPANEDLGSLFKEFTKTILEAINHSMPNTSPEAQEARNEYARHILCLFCGGPHPIRKCATVDQYIKAGKCRRNHEGRIILSSGAWIPRDMPGTNFKERIDEWHRRNPGQLAAASLIHTIDARILYNDEKPQDIYQLSSKDRIATLEAELFSLRARNPQASNVRTRAQRAREGNHEDSDEEDVAAIRRGKKPQMYEEQAAPSKPSGSYHIYDIFVASASTTILT